MKYKLTFSWRDEVVTTRQVILEADCPICAEAQLSKEIDNGMRDEIGKEMDKEYWDVDDQLNIQVEESK